MPNTFNLDDLLDAADLKSGNLKDPDAGIKGQAPKVNSNGSKPSKPKASKPKVSNPHQDILDYLLIEYADHEGHARCTNELYAGKFAHSEHVGWMFYNGKYWERENAEATVERAIVETLLTRRVLAVKHQREELVKKTMANRSNVMGTREQLKSLVSVNISEFDRDPDLLNCQNGVLNLKTGLLAPHDQSQKFTYCVAVDYDAAADPSLFVDFLRAATDNDNELLTFLQEALGYTLTGHTWEECLFYLFGPSRSGKGTLTEVLLKMLGGKPIAAEAEFVSFTAKRDGDTQNFDLAPLKPCRFVAASEGNKHLPLNPAKIKQITGGNEIYCAFKHRDHFNYRPQFKIWLSSNHPINIDLEDDAAWGRIFPVSFPVSHLGAEDKTLKKSLTTDPVNLRGALRWMVDGAMRWYSLPKGLQLPASSVRLKESQRLQQDFIRQFLDEMTEDDSDPGAFVLSSDLHKRYKDWCDANGVPPKHQNQFSQALAAKGYTLDRELVEFTVPAMGTEPEKKIKKQVRVVRGLKVKTW